MNKVVHELNTIIGTVLRDVICKSRDVKMVKRGKFMVTLSLLILSMIFGVLALSPNAAAVDCGSCHISHTNEIAATYHGGVNQCILCHTGGYTSSPWVHPDTLVTETRCRVCHIQGTNLNESHGNLVGGPNYADCRLCHFPNVTVIDELTERYKHSHNLTVEYNFYYYNLSGIPLITNNGNGKGVFPYYTCTLTCHIPGSATDSLEDEVIGWNESAHARSLHYPASSDNKNSCAKCKSPPNFDGNTSNTSTITAANWQGIQCRVCHNLHNDTYSGNGSSPIYYAFYNSTLTAGGLSVYDMVSNATELCEKCHLTFNDDINSTHNSNYGGSHKTTVGFDCADCHMNSTSSNLTHKFEVKNTTSGVTGCLVCHNYVNSHTNFTQRSYHDNKVDCVACHDQTFTVNASGYAVYTFPNNSAYSYGLWNVSGNWTTYFKKSATSIKSWPLHNITGTVTCTKCHNATSAINGTIATALTCSNCHSSYASAVNSSNHNRTRNASAPDCTGCHAGYEPSYGHTTGNRSFIVNESNTCRNCHIDGVNEFYERHRSTSDCTQCHFANTTQSFNLNTSLFTHDHNLTVEYNFYNYNLSGMPLTSNVGSGKGMFPYYSCTLACHGSYGEPLKIDEAASSWFNSSHARSLHYPASADNKQSCAKCKSPTNYNVSLSSSATIAAADWQGIQCRVCHNLHDRKFPNNTGPSGFPIAFYNSTLSSQNGYATYQQLNNSTQLCEKCHLTFNDDINSTHNSNYGGSHRTTVGFNCTDCHMNSTFNNELHVFEVKNTTSGVTGCQVCHNYVNSHSNFSMISYHDNKVDCVACHDQTVSVNSSGYAVFTFPNNSAYSYGLWNVSGNWTTYFKKSASSIKSWPLHNITSSVTCTKCHNATSAINGSIATALTCSNCHSSYASAVNSSNHNRTRNASAPDCTGCHSGYQPEWNHATGTKGYIVNETNSCRSCHVEGVNLNESHGNHGYGQNYADCTQCHFANTTQSFSLNTSLFTHDHNLTVEYNYYNYNLYGMPLSTNGGVGKGMFPYYTCTLTCHNGTGGGQPKIENETIAWNQSKHAKATRGSTYNNSCTKCHSPPVYNASNGATIATGDKQGIQCRVCHNLHNDTYSGNGTPPINTAFYNATLSSSAGSPVYDTVANATELCEKCHAGGYHATSRDIYYNGSHKTSLGFTCANCHMNSTLNNGSEHSFEVKNNVTTKTGCEACHVATSEHTTSNFREYSSHLNVTCDACHDGSFVRNSTDYVVNVSTGRVAGGIYKSNNNWTTYMASTSSRTGLTTLYPDWAFHNISKNVSCDKCHGALSVISGAIAPNLTSGGTTYFTTDALFVGYNYIVPWLYPEPTIYANYLINSSLSGVTGVNKTLNWNSTSQDWEGYENIGGVYIGTNFTVVGKTPYFVNSLSAGNKYTFRGTK